MATRTDKVLSFGAAGHFAGLVVDALVQRDAPVRGLVHHEADRDGVLARGAQEVVVADLADRASIDRAMEGVDAVYYIAPAFQAGLPEAGRRVVDAAVAAGVQRFVFSSVIHPALSALSNHADAASVEEAVLDSGLEFTLLQPAFYFQNYASRWPDLVHGGKLAEPFSPDSRLSRVDFRDVAEVAAIALLEDRLVDGTFELCAPGKLNRHQVAALIGEVLGREIEVGTLDPSTFGEESAPMQAMFEHYDRVGLVGNSLTLEAILGREPRSFRAFFEELAARDADGRRKRA